MEAKEKVLAIMKEAGTPLNAGKIAEPSRLEKQTICKPNACITNKML